MKPLPDDQIDAALEGLSGWTREGDALRREWTFADFREAVGFLVRMAFEAESRDHHPEVWNVYNRVRLTLTTHDAGNRITEKDVALARALSDLSS
jgi:4a-hydroxytetrahydrobiopterin dehydratase